MGKLPTFKCCPDHWDFERAIRNTSEANRGYLHHQLRTGAVARDAVAARVVAFQDSYCRRVFEAQRVPLEQGYREIFSVSGYCAVHWTLVEPDGDTGPEW